MWRFLMCAVLVLGGCVGNDEDTVMSAVGDPPVVEDREQIETLASGYRSHPAFERQWALARIGADVAYARLAIEHGEDVRPGAGVTVGVYDTGIDQDHPAFAETRIDEVFLPGTFDEMGVMIPSHGTAVASVIAGLKAACEGDANLLPPILEAVRAYATLGEICGAMREVFGEYRPPTVI